MKSRLSKAGFAAVVFFLVLTATLNAQSAKRKVSIGDPIEVGKVGMGTAAFLSSAINQAEAVISFDAGADQAQIRFSQQGVKHQLYLGAKARATLIEAVGSYRKDFDERTLNLKAKKTENVYGAAEAELEWGTITLNKNSLPKANYGYVFVDRKRPRPYFTITLQKARNLGQQVDNMESDNESARIVLYFTKNQATELAEMLLPDNLQDIAAEAGVRDYSEEPDIYEE